jgi:hypothetical protein
MSCLPLLHRALLVCVAALHLMRQSAQGADAQKDPEAQAVRYPLITVPKLEKAPTIDGTISKSEWIAAAQSSPLLVMEGSRVGMRVGKLYGSPQPEDVIL